MQHIANKRLIQMTLKRRELDSYLMVLLDMLAIAELVSPPA